jgi:hypothetical protein
MKVLQNLDDLEDRDFCLHSLIFIVIVIATPFQNSDYDYTRNEYMWFLYGTLKCLGEINEGIRQSVPSMSFVYLWTLLFRPSEYFEF